MSPQSNDRNAIDPTECLCPAFAVGPSDPGEIRADAAYRTIKEDELPLGQYGPTEDFGEDG